MMLPDLEKVVYFGIFPVNAFPDNVVHVVMLHDLPLFPHSHEAHDLMTYIPQEHMSCKSVHVGVVTVHHPPHHQPPEGAV